jgi:hypothetical protein
MQPEAAHLLRFGRVGRAAEEGGELLDPLHVVMLGFWRELAIVMSSIMRRRNGLTAWSVMEVLLS